MTVDDYVRALDGELRGQPRRVRRHEAAGLREHLAELPPGALDELEPPEIYAREYLAQRDLRTPRFTGAWRSYSWPFRALLVVTALVVVAIVVGPILVSHYQPVSVDIESGGPDTVASHEDHGTTVYAFREGGIVRMGVDFSNSGRFDATITGLADTGELGPLELAAVKVAAPYSFTTGRAARFPIRIAAHSAKTLLLTFRLTTCKYGAGGQGDGGGSIGIVQLFFPTKILGVHHRLVALLPSEAWFDLPKHLDPCPARPASPPLPPA